MRTQLQHEVPVPLSPKDATWPALGLPKGDIGSEPDELVGENEPGNTPSDDSDQRLLRSSTRRA